MAADFGVMQVFCGEELRGKLVKESAFFMYGEARGKGRAQIVATDGFGDDRPVKALDLIVAGAAEGKKITQEYLCHRQFSR